MQSEGCFSSRPARRAIPLMAVQSGSSVDIVVVPPFTVERVLIHPFTVAGSDPHQPESTRITTGSRYVVLQCLLKALENAGNLFTPWDGNSPQVSKPCTSRMSLRDSAWAAMVGFSGCKGTAG